MGTSYGGASSVQETPGCLTTCMASQGHTITSVLMAERERERDSLFPQK